MVSYMIYSSIDNPKIKDIKKLHNKKYRDGLFLVEGEHLVLEAYKAGFLEELLIEENSRFSLDIKTNYLTKKVIKHISLLDTPSSIMGLCKKKEGKLQGEKIVILSKIQDPGNLGTIIRSCLAFNVDTLVLNNCVDIYNSKVIRATQGAIFNLNIVISDLKEIIKDLKKQDFIIYGTSINKGIVLKDVPKQEKNVIIIGNEGNGLTEETEKLCDKFINIEMNKNCESLNVAVATSIILYEFSR